MALVDVVLPGSGGSPLEIPVQPPGLTRAICAFLRVFPRGSSWFWRRASSFPGVPALPASVSILVLCARIRGLPIAVCILVRLASLLILEGAPPVFAASRRSLQRGRGVQDQAFDKPRVVSIRPWVS